MFKKDPLQIIVFQTYGKSNHLYLRGRAIEDECIDLKKQGGFKLLFNAWKRFETDEIKNTKLQVKVGDDVLFYTITDSNGYFLLNEKVEGLCKYINDEGWLKLELSYKKDQLRTIQSENQFYGEMLIPSKKASFGIISDIDDTILHTGLTSILKWRVLINTFLTSAGKRLPLEGAPEFYHLLHKGKTEKEANPIFYVSHSPWNLYRYLEYFLNKNNFPRGPIILRDFSKIFSKKSKDEKPEKHKEIINILNTYPALKFILIGDIGQHDSEIYLDIVKNNPSRILAIYLRSVKNKQKVLAVTQLYKDFNCVPVLLIKDKNEALVHAQKHGFIKL